MRKNRPIDILQNLFTESGGQQTTDLITFFNQ